MRLNAGQLTRHLKARDLAPIYCVSGDEPLQLLETADTIRHFTREQGFDEREVLVVEKDFDWDRLQLTGSNLSLFSSKRLIELRLGNQKPGREGGAALADYAAAPDPDSVLLITAARLDKQAQQSRWFKAVDSIGITIPIWPVEPAKLPDWIIDRSRRLGKEISRDAADLIAVRVEGNLLAARQELEKLSLLIDKPRLEAADIMLAVTDSSRYEVFAMIESAMLGSPDRTVRMLHGLRQEGTEAINIFGALAWELRRLCSMAVDLENGVALDRLFGKHRVWKQRQKATACVLKRMDSNRIRQLLREANVLDQVMKGAVRDNPWNLLENFVLRLAGCELRTTVKQV